MVNRKAILLALILSVCMGWGAYVFLKKRGKADSAGTREVLVALNPIPERQVLSAQMFVKKTVPEGLFSKDMVTKLDPDIGHYARHSLLRGEILYQSKLGIVDEEPELSYMIDRPQGVVTIGVTDITGISGILKPGDYVDVYATYTKAQLEGLPKESRVEAITRRIVPGCKVVAAGDEVISPVGGPGAALAKFNRKRVPHSLKRVTLAVNDTDMEKIIFAYTNGKVHLALKTDAEVETDKLPGFSSRDLQKDLFVKKDVHNIECFRADKSELVQVER